MAAYEPLEMRTATVSDLFFNYHHPSYEDACERHEAYEKLEEALMKDAISFIQAYGNMVRLYVPEMTIDPEWLYNDFFKRL